MTILNERIKSARKKKGYTQEEVGNSIGVSKQTIQRYESGEITNIPADKIEAIALFLGVTPGYLMGWDTDDKNKKRYYLNPETARLAQEVYDNPDLRILFDASRHLTPEDIRFVVEMVKKMKGLKD